MDDSEDSTGENEDVDITNSQQPNLNIPSLLETSFAAVEEFQAMGLRPMEFRPEVIRRAMKRSAVPLATLHLNHPGGVVERRLSQLVTTGYRLLDPRRREDITQRMMLGRIHPQLADELVRETQAKGQALMAPDASEEIGVDLEVASDLLPGQTHRIGQSPPSSKGSFLADDLSSPWSQSLQSQDLLVDRPIRRVLRSTRNWAMKRPVSITATLGFMAVACGAWTVFKTDHTQRIAQQQSKDVSTVANMVAASPAPTIVAETALNSIRAMIPDSIGRDRDIAKIFPPVVTTQAPASKDAKTAMDAKKAMAEPMPVVVLNQIVPVADEVPLPSFSSSPLIAKSINRSEAVESPDLSKTEIGPRTPISSGKAVVDIEDIAGAETKLPIPSESELAEAVTALEQSLSKVGTREWKARLETSLEIADKAKAAGPPFMVLTALRGAATYAVLAGDHPAADSAMLAIAEQFDTDLDSIALSISTKVVELAKFDVETRQVVLWLGNFTGRSLVTGQLDHAEQFASLLGDIAKDLDDEAAIERSKEFAKTMVSIRRFEATAVAVDSELDRKVSGSDHFAAGRYWALVRRDWVKALPHLSASSDTRLAALASSEMLMGGMPDPQDLLELAAGYLALAEKTKGWLADSYALHAEEILRLQTSARSSSSDLELRRVMSKISEQFAPAFSLAKRMEVVKNKTDDEKVRQSLIGSKQVPSSQADAVASEPALAGKLLLNGQDTGTSIRYEPGVVLSSSIYDQIEERAKLRLADASMELSGIIHVERPTAIMIQVATPSGADDQTVTIDGKSLIDTKSTTSFDSSVTIYRADLGTGTWTLRWNVSKLVTGLSLQIMDGLSGSPVSLMNTSAKDENDDLNRPPRLRVTIASSR